MVGLVNFSSDVIFTGNTIGTDMGVATKTFSIPVAFPEIYEKRQIIYPRKNPRSDQGQ